MRSQKDRQYTYNVTLKCVCITITASKEQQILNIKSACLYSCLSYPAHKGHLLYCDVLQTVARLALAYFWGVIS